MHKYRHAIVTGGSSGIGLALCQRLVSEGWHVSLIARNEERLERARTMLERNRRESGQVIETIAADVAERAQIERAVGMAMERLGAPDLLITSAGIAHPGYFEELPVEVFEKAMAVNYFGTLYAVRAALPEMLARGTGRVVLISSGTGLIGIYGYTAYGASKFALRGLAEALRAELRFHGIGISIVYPPDTDTPQLAAENLIKPRETKAIAGTAKVLSAQAVADCILDGVRRGKFDITPGLTMRLLNRFHSVLAPLLFRHFDHLASKARKDSHR